MACAPILHDVPQPPHAMKQQYLGFRLGERDYVTSLDAILEVRAYDVRRI